ncbi:het domain-containing protein [Colletotrichum incanum]|uniref:Het domain-containing protein n=1 Tax=Colletotrichum incanum TaxID=1573173 RepID=A0A166PQL7_COLIC|nr:het domain-containing protein [Colletotrichum incanum]
MRLINVDTLQLEEFFDEEIPEYATLSHTWGKDEISFQDLCWLHEYEGNCESFASIETILPSLGRSSAEKAHRLRRRSGFDKIVQTAQLAKAKRLRYAWVDTCCIDKTSSAELSEAINSMFRWYQDSKICFAFLSDVVLQTGNFPTNGEWEYQFARSRWFTRGWTLQELLAPRSLVFFDRNWNAFGEKSRLAELISISTKIPYDILRRERRLQDVALASRMSWASGRQTSRKEDMAYCLLGLCDINMPLLYGEGEKSFLRLQQEIIKEYSDQSLFAWGVDQTISATSSIFAPSPAFFTRAGSLSLENFNSSSSDFQMTNRGLQIELPLVRLPVFKGTRSQVCYYAILDVKDRDLSHLCFPLFSPRFHEDGMQNGDEFLKSPCGPIRLSNPSISKSHVIGRMRVVILKDAASMPTSHFGNCLFTIPPLPFELNTEVRETRIVETFPPTVSLDPQPNGETTLHLPSHWMPTQGYGAFLLRFIIPIVSGDEPTINGASERQFVIVHTIGYATSGKDKTRVIKWPLHPRTAEGSVSIIKTFPSIVDAVLDNATALREVSGWLEEPEFRVGGKYLRAVVVKSDDELGTRIKWSLG